MGQGVGVSVRMCKYVYTNPFIGLCIRSVIFFQLKILQWITITNKIWKI